MDASELLMEEELIEKLAFSIYRGQDFKQFKFKPKEFLIDSLIHRGDDCLLIGSPKSGKSLFVKQMICSLTSAHPFLNKYAVARPTKVCYVQLEGRAEDTQDRLLRMEGTCPIMWDNLSIFYSSPLFLQDPSETKDFIKTVEIGGNHEVIVIDGLYLAFSGSLSDDDAVRKFLGNLRIIKNYFNATIIVVHHTHKVRFNDKGEVIFEGDSAVFGSQFLRAYPDHIFMLGVQKNSDVRELKCSTQRSGMIETDIKMKLIQPNPLHFETLDEVPTGTVKDNWKKKIMAYLNGAIIGGAHAFEIQHAMGIPKSTFYNVMGNLILDGQVFKDGDGKAALYRSLQKDVS
jgi:hypothetical protein